ncbi:MAG: SDR family oxidoreductase [Lachnospiraceae bacterium]|nr:SDR family oxidoreductase [Lachnospiraceae bacterium]
MNAKKKNDGNIITSNGSALVTGASRGIGKAIARALAEEGYDLFLTCRQTVAELKALAQALEKEHGVQVLPVQCDMGDPDQVRKLFQKIEGSASFAELELVVNNAGISYIGLLQDMSDASWEEVISTNLNSVFYTSREAIPLFLQNRFGRIINISSVWGEVGASTEAAYSASKGGVHALTKALAKELAPSGITVNAIACGVIDTAMNDHFSAEEKEDLRQEIPADRFGTPEDVAQMVLSILRGPGYLTGQVIHLDGGWQ